MEHKGSGEMNESMKKNMPEDKFCKGCEGMVGENMGKKKMPHKEFKGKGGK